MNRTRTMLVGLAAAATIAAPLTARPATAASAPRKVPNLIDATLSSIFISPNGDRVQDRVRLPYKLKRKSVVTVKVYRTYDAKDSRLLFTDKLGKVARGKHTYRWDGKKPNGKVVRDNRYSVAFFADPVKERIKDASDNTIVHVDTKYTAEPLQAGATTVYPNTTVISDEIGFNHGGWGWAANGVGEYVREATVVVADAAGNVVRSERQPYQNQLYYPLTWDGRDDSGTAVPAGTYTVRLDVTDQAGNKGTSDPIEVTVSAAPLVFASGQRTVAPVAGPLPPAPESAGANLTTAARTGDGRASTTGGDDVPWEPCGTVFASTIYPDQGASFRSKADCVEWTRDEARGSGRLQLRELVAPRGLQSVQLSMRGRPTLAADVDTARLGFGLEGSGSTVTTKSSAVTGESVTTTPVLNNPWDATSFRRPLGVDWTITTFGFDAYDVADITVSYTYLTPQTP